MMYYMRLLDDLPSEVRTLDTAADCLPAGDCIADVGGA